MTRRVNPGIILEDIKVTNQQLLNLEARYRTQKKRALYKVQLEALQARLRKAEEKLRFAGGVGEEALVISNGTVEVTYIGVTLEEALAFFRYREKADGGKLVRTIKLGVATIINSNGAQKIESQVNENLKEPKLLK